MMLDNGVTKESIVEAPMPIVEDNKNYIMDVEI